MNKKKAIICTILFAIIVIGIAIVFIFAKPYGSERSLFHIFCPFIVGDWLGKKITEFYGWLRYNN